MADKLNSKLGGMHEDPQQLTTRSGKAEFYALTKSASRALGVVAMTADVAKVVKPRVRVDATVAAES